MRVYPGHTAGDRGPLGALALGALLAAALLLGAASRAEAGAAIYRYIDDHGVVHFTNVSQDSRYTVVAMRGGRARIQAVPPALRRRYDPLIRRAAHATGLPPALVKAVIHAESSFDARAVSPKGAMGLMQLMPRTAAFLGVDRPFEAEENVEGGSRYLRMLHDRYGSWAYALAAYNAGPQAVDEYRGVPPFAETRNYVRRVLSYYRRYHGDFPR